MEEATTLALAIWNLAIGSNHPPLVAIHASASRCQQNRRVSQPIPWALFFVRRKGIPSARRFSNQTDADPLAERGSTSRVIAGAPLAVPSRDRLYLQCGALASEQSIRRSASLRLVAGRRAEDAG